MRLSKSVAAVAAGTVIVGGGLAGSAQADAAKPPQPTYRSTGHGPTWHPRGGQLARAIEVDVTSPSRGCVVINRGGGDLGVKATNVNGGRGLVVDTVTLYAINPSGDRAAERGMYRTAPGTYQGAAHLAATSRPGVWSAVVAAKLRGADSTAIHYGATSVCVQRNAYAGYIRTTDRSPYNGQRITLSADMMGLNPNGRSYGPQPNRTMSLVRKDGGAWVHVATAKTNSRGRAYVTVKFTGESEFAFTYAGSRDFAPFSSNALTVG